MVGEYRIRRLRAEEMDLPIEWAREEGWNPGLHDGECFHTTDPNGFFVGELGGVPVGVVSGVAYDNTFGFLGFYIVKPEYRSKGYGISLARATWEYMGDRNMGLDGVLERVADYGRTGFKLAYQNFRYEGVGGGTLPPGLTPLSTVPFEHLVAYDRQCFPAERRTFLRKWIQQPGATCLAVVDGGTLKGYGVIRACFQGHKIGPLFADSAEIAEDLFQGLAASVPGQAVYLDTPEPNQEAVNLTKRHGMKLVFGTARMYSKGEPQISMNKVFGVTSFELG